MFTGRVIRNRVLIDDPKSASSLRNKGFLGVNIGEKLSLDVFTAYFLFSKKRLQVFSGNKLLGNEDILNLIGDKLHIFHAFKFLREKGYKPSIRRGAIYVDGERVLILKYHDYVNFNKLRKKKNNVIVVDDEGDCILYDFETFRFNDPRIKKILEQKKISGIYNIGKISIRSGSKYGSDYRIYEENATHAKYLLNIEDTVSTKDLVARVRVAHSVKKLYVQGYYIKGLRFVLVKWVTV